MTQRATNHRRWRIGDLARATGLTVRTLHHYESIGLLEPPTRTDGQQRLYGEHDVRRLYRICALRDLGLSLADIGRVLERDGAELSDVLRAHRDRVDVEIQRLESLRTLLDSACMRADGDVAADDVLATIEAMSQVTRRSNARRQEKSVPTDAEARWRALGDELRACMMAGEPASAARPRALARTAHEWIVEFAGGDQATLEALAHLRRFAPPENLAGWTPPLMQYLDQALTSLQETKTEHAERTDREERGTGTPRHRLATLRRSEASDRAAGDGAGESTRALADRLPRRTGGARARRRAI